MRIVVLGLSITSSWGNGHATTYRALLRAMARRGHDVLFLERDTEWYARARDMPSPEFCRVALYDSVERLRAEHAAAVREADAVIVGSYVPDGIEVGRWTCATARGAVVFYDIDTPITLAALRRGACPYIAPDLIPAYDMYLSFTGGRSLSVLESTYGSPAARVLYCSVDPELYAPQPVACRWTMGYLGTYSTDRQPTLDALLLEPARRRPEARFVVAGPQYPDDVAWPPNVDRAEHVPPAVHRAFYCAQRATLNVTRAAMRRLGHAPSVRLFEAAACGVAIVSDAWPGIDELFVPGAEILLADGPERVLSVLDTLGPEELAAIGDRGRARVLSQHTADHRAERLEMLLRDARDAAARRRVGLMVGGRE